MKKFFVSLFLALSVVAASAQIRVIPPDATAFGCEYYFVQPGHAYSLVEDRYPEDVYFYDFDIPGSIFGFCTSPDWPYEHVVYDLGQSSGLQPLVPANPVGFFPAGSNPNPRVIVNESVNPPVSVEVDVSLTHLTVSFQRVAGRRYSVETSSDGVHWVSRGHEWFVPAFRSGSHTVSVPLDNTNFFRVRRVK